MDLRRLVDGGLGQDEGRESLLSHALVDAIDGKGQGQPVVDDGLEIRDIVGVEVRVGLLQAAVRQAPLHLDPEVGGGLQGVGDVQGVSPGLGPVLPGVAARAGGDEAVLPVGGGPFR